jgi:hypothetical protein
MIHCVYLLSVLVVAKLPTSAYAGWPDTSDNCYDLGYTKDKINHFREGTMIHVKDSEMSITEIIHIMKALWTDVNQ